MPLKMTLTQRVQAMEDIVYAPIATCAAAPEPPAPYLIKIEWTGRYWTASIYEYRTGWYGPDSEELGYREHHGEHTFSAVKFSHRDALKVHRKAKAYVDGLLAARADTQLLEAITGGTYRELCG